MAEARHLVALAGDAPADVRARIAAVGRISATMPPRLLVVEGPAELAGRLAAVAGVRLVAVADATTGWDNPPNDGERLFIAGFFASGAREGARAGESLPWDAPGFQPPDRNTD